MDKKEIINSVLYGIVMPLILIYGMAYIGIINFNKSGWILPGAIIVGGAAVLMAGFYIIKKVIKR